MTGKLPEVYDAEVGDEMHMACMATLRDVRERLAAHLAGTGIVLSAVLGIVDDLAVEMTDAQEDEDEDEDEDDDGPLG